MLLIIVNIRDILRYFIQISDFTQVKWFLDSAWSGMIWVSLVMTWWVHLIFTPLWVTWVKGSSHFICDSSILLQVLIQYCELVVYLAQWILELTEVLLNSVTDWLCLLITILQCLLLDTLLLLCLILLLLLRQFLLGDHSTWWPTLQWIAIDLDNVILDRRNGLGPPKGVPMSIAVVLLWHFLALRWLPLHKWRLIILRLVHEVLL